MNLYLVQHAEAVSKEEDPSRSLSKKGIEDIEKVAEFSRGLNIEVRQILHSGKTRALQTAQMLGKKMVSDPDAVETEGLAPMDEPEIWFARLTEISEDTMLVGHLPHLGKLAMLLLCGNKEKEIISFEMGNIVCLKRSAVGTWTADWIIKPRMLK